MVNVRLNPSLWGKAKSDAGRRGITLERWMSEAIAAHLARESAADTVATTENGPTLEWRIAALEEAVDYLASSIGASLPGAQAERAGVGR